MRDSALKVECSESVEECDVGVLRSAIVGVHAPPRISRLAIPLRLSEAAGYCTGPGPGALIKNSVNRCARR